jgi:hypothetical protein
MEYEFVLRIADLPSWQSDRLSPLPIYSGNNRYSATTRHRSWFDADSDPLQLNHRCATTSCFVNGFFFAR